MSNQYIIYNFCAEIQGTGNWSESTVRPNCYKKLSCRKEPCDVQYRWKFYCHSKSLSFSFHIYNARWSVFKFLFVFLCNYVSI